MSVLNPNSDEEPQDCPLCLEYLELDDINFYPCSCGYQICRFCWNKIRTEGNGQCPACRAPYSENPADFKPLTAEELAKIKAEKRQKDIAKKQRISENRKHLANVRVVQKNLVFVVGLSPKLADSEVLKRPEYFGRFGRIHKVVINTSTTYAGNHNQGPSASAYVTYYKSEDALRAIQAVNNVLADGRTLKASLGTTKYCSHFMKNMPCPKHDCMYLHELGDEAASFTKEEMQQGKHTEYEKNLHEELSMNSSSSVTTSTTSAHPASANSVSAHSESSIVASSSTTTLVTSTSARDSVNSSSPSGIQQQQVVIGSGTVQAPNGRATSENSDKISSRSPSPVVHHQITNGGWPNLGMDSKKNRQFDPPTQQRNPTPPYSTDHMVNGNADVSHRVGGIVGNDLIKPPSIPSDLNHDSGGGGGPIINNTTSTNGPPPGLVGGLLKDTFKDDLFEEDDLGFDPFHETQKALAEMLESESKQQQQQQQRHILQQQTLMSQQQQHTRQSNESPSSSGVGNLNPLRHESPVMNRNAAPGFTMANLRGGGNAGNGAGFGNPAHDTSNQFSGSNSAVGNHRVKQPPPGFDPLSMLNSGPAANGQQNTQRNLLSPDMGLLNLEALTSQLNLNAGFGTGHPNDLSVSRHEQNGPGNGFGGGHGGLLSNHHLHNGMGLGGLKTENHRQHQQQQGFLLDKQPQIPSKDWQDGLRALLPNVNVSFGALPQHGTSNGQSAADRMFSQQPAPGLSLTEQHHHHHERMQRQQHQSRPVSGGWNSVKSPHANDWTTLDPAIVTGQVADSLSHNAGLRADSPPGWLKNNLEQLTAGDQSIGGRFSGLNGSNNAGLIPGLAGLGLGGGGQQPPHGPHGHLGGQWGQPTAPVMSNTPPPGFALNRGQMGLGQPSVSQPHPFSALAGLGGGNTNGSQDRDSHIESELARLVRS